MPGWLDYLLTKTTGRY